MIKLIQTSDTFGDSTALYGITMSHDYTVKEFIDHVLKQKEWGYINICDPHGNSIANGEYKGKDLIEQIPDEFLNNIVTEADGHGGWTRMDYKLFI